MKAEAPIRQRPMQGQGAMGFDDVLMRSHALRSSTFCSSLKHKSSLASFVLAGDERRMEIGKRISAARKAKGWSQNRLADAVNVGQTTVSSWEKGRTEPTREMVARISRALSNVNLEAPESDGLSSTIPIVGYVGASAEFFGFDDHQKGAGLEEIATPPGVPPNAVAVVVRGDSGYPAYLEGNVLIFWNKMEDPSPIIGEKCFIKLTDGRTLVKILERGAEAGLWTLVSINSAMQPIRNVRIDWAAPIEVALRRKNWQE